MDYIKDIKCIVAEQAYEQLKHNLENVNTKELGEVVDMIKDMAEAEYYCTVVEAMEKAKEENEYYEKRMYYDPAIRLPVKEKDKDWKEELPDWLKKPHDYNEPVARDMREGRSPLTRRMYMEGKEHHEGKEVQMQELEKYMGELSQDVTEMIMDSTPEEKAMLHKKLAALTSKIELLMANPHV